MKQQWDEARIPGQSGKTVIVTGSSSGLGWGTAAALAGKGAEVILAVRNIRKGNAAADRIRRRHGNANVKVMLLDLGDLSSIRSFAEAYGAQQASLSVLINNAGVMMPPYQRTKDGFELQFGTNHLGHYALTGLLLPLLLRTPHSRVVTVGSLAARSGCIDFDNLDGSKGYRGFAFYRQSKLANVLFAKELQRRLDQAGTQTVSIACHPGIAATNITSRGSGKSNGLLLFLMNRLFQSAERGALPSLYAATYPSLKGGEYIGPDGKGAKKGYPAPDPAIGAIYDPAVAERLWEVSERLTGIRYSFQFQ